MLNSLIQQEDIQYRNVPINCNWDPPVQVVVYTNPLYYCTCSCI